MAVFVSGAPIKYSRCPNQSMWKILRAYFEDGVIPEIGDFAYEILTNDLKGACMCADDVNRALIFEWVQWFYNYVPAGAWGSVAAVMAYSTMRKEDLAQP